jgi:uncharacterized protein YdhG (YjbR/CyaY superfamily)
MGTGQKTPKTIDEYIAGFPHEVQEILEKFREAIRKAAPDAEETISYQIPAFTLKGNLVHFAAFKRHIGSIRERQQLRSLRMSFLFMKAQRVRLGSN